jgi:hypothetical protein
MDMELPKYDSPTSVGKTPKNHKQIKKLKEKDLQKEDLPGPNSSTFD